MGLQAQVKEGGAEHPLAAEKPKPPGGPGLEHSYVHFRLGKPPLQWDPHHSDAGPSVSPTYPNLSPNQTIPA